ncbi:hypothetical protein AgCh_017800 [Apium graveolens]
MLDQHKMGEDMKKPLVTPRNLEIDFDEEAYIVPTPKKQAMLRLNAIKLQREELELEEKAMRASLEETKEAKNSRKEKRVMLRKMSPQTLTHTIKGGGWKSY